jgi:hypothetical protein
LHAAFAADAAAIVEIHDAVIALEQCGDRTDFDARRVFTMVATHDGEQAPRVREFSFLNILYPRAVDANGHIMLGFACDSASVATDAFTVVDDETEVHSFLAANLKCNC